MTTRRIALPGLVKVFWNDYDIELLTPREAALGNRYGEVSHMDRAIRLDSGAAVPQQAQTLLHELLHCVCEVMFPELSSKKEEKIVRKMADGLSTLIRDNPQTFRWIIQEIE